MFSFLAVICPYVRNKSLKSCLEIWKYWNVNGGSCLLFSINWKLRLLLLSSVVVRQIQQLWFFRHERVTKIIVHQNLGKHIFINEKCKQMLKLRFWKKKFDFLFWDLCSKFSRVFRIFRFWDFFSKSSIFSDFRLKKYIYIYFSEFQFVWDFEISDFCLQNFEIFIFFLSFRNFDFLSQIN